MRNFLRTDATVLAGRILLSLIFVMSSLGKIADWNGTAGYMASKGMVAIGFFLPAAVAVELLGGLSVMTGFKARWGASLLFLFLIPVTLIFHDFWTLNGMDRQMQTIHFMKNMAIMGGLLTLAGSGAGSFRLGKGGRQ